MMESLLKRLADFTLGFVALLTILHFLPTKIEPQDILMIAISILFVSFIILITNHVSKLEKTINEINKNFKTNERLNKLEIKVFKKWVNG